MFGGMETPPVRTKVGAQVEPRSPELRSRVSNHRDLLPNLDGRSAEARRYRDLVSAYISDAGGLDNCSEVRVGLARRLAALVVQSEAMEARLLSGEPVDVAKLCTLASTIVRISSRLGLRREAKTVGPSIADLLREDLEHHHQERKREAEAETP